MEIERKWLVTGWPENLPLVKKYLMRQGYLCTSPTVRIREEAMIDGDTDYVLCFKSRGEDGGIMRKEIEISIPEDKFRELEDLIGIPLIEKERRVYALKDDLKMEVNEVDVGFPTQFMYVEIEFRSLEQAKAWTPEADGLENYLGEDVTDQPGQTMGAYWNYTRLGKSLTED